MIFQEVKPLPQLQDLVKNYLLVNLKSETDLSATPYATRIEQTLIFFARGYILCKNPETGITSQISKNAVFGQQISRLNFQAVQQEDFMMLMVIFQPGGLHRLLGVPASELLETFCDAALFLNQELNSVNNAIANTYNYQKMIDYVDRFLLAKISSIKLERHRIDRIGNYLMENPDYFSLDYISNQACLSPRQLERKFKERFGIGPKLYNRISRFYKAFMYKDKNPETDWMTVALTFGYSDYNHMAKDFKQFANVTPNILLEEYAKRPEAFANRFINPLK